MCLFTSKLIYLTHNAVVVQQRKPCFWLQTQKVSLMFGTFILKCSEHVCCTVCFWNLLGRLVPAAARKEKTQEGLFTAELPQLRRFPELVQPGKCAKSELPPPQQLPGHRPSQHLSRSTLQGAMVSGTSSSTKYWTVFVVLSCLAWLVDNTCPGSQGFQSLQLHLRVTSHVAIKE